MKSKLLSDCKNCIDFEGMVFGKLVVCNYLKNEKTLIITKLSNENTEFPNGSTIVYCKNNYGEN